MTTSPKNGKRDKESQAPYGYFNVRILKRQAEVIEKHLDVVRRTRPEVTKQMILNDIIDYGIHGVIIAPNAEAGTEDSTVLTSPG